MQRYTIEDLNALVREFCKAEGSLVLLEKIRELTLLLYVSKGDIPPNGFIELFNNAQFLDMKSIESYTKNIVPLKECYPNLQEVEKELLNIVIFIFDILNGESKRGVVGFLKRTFLFSPSSTSIQLRYTFNFIKHTLKLEDKERKILLNEVLDKEYFFGLRFVEQKNIIENIRDFIDIETLNAVHLLLEESMKRNDIALQMQLYAMIDSLQGINATIEKDSSNFYLQWAEQEQLPTINTECVNRKKEIGIVVDTLVDNEVGRTILSLAKSLVMNEVSKRILSFSKSIKETTFSIQEYEIVIYSLNNSDENSELLVSQFISAGCKIYDCYDIFQKEELFEKALFLRKKILDNSMEYLIATDINAISNFLLSTRSAKKQLFWSFDGRVTSIRNIEMQISHIIQNKNNSQLDIFTIYEKDEFLAGKTEIQEQAQNIKKTFLAQMGKESVILGTIDAIQRINSDSYMQDIALIMQKNPHAIYFICGSGNINGIKQKIEKFDIDVNRFTFMDSFDRHLFGWLIDIYIDDWSAIYTHIMDEMINKQKPVVLYSEEESQKFVATVSELIEKRDAKFYEDFAKKEYKDWNEKRKEENSFIDILESC